MTGEPQLFVTTRVSRAKALALPLDDVAFKRLLEQTWVESLGLDMRQITASTSETPPSKFDTTTPSTVGTDDADGSGIHSDPATDHETDNGPTDSQVDI